MVSEVFDRFVIAALCLLTVLVLSVVVARAVPLLLIDEVPGDLNQADADAARFALGQVESAGGAAQRAIRVRSSVVSIEPDPAGCQWGYPGDIAAIVTVKTYTIFGLPAGTWRVDCHGPNPTAP